MIEDIIRLAREAQLSKDGFGAWLAMDEDRLIKLAISEAKDAWAEQEMDNIWQAIKIEREACAKVCLSLNLYGPYSSRDIQFATLEDCARAIRNRSEE
jgi:hypothetical protein